MAILFIPGITVRHDRHQRLVELVRDGMTEARANVEVHGCYWADLASSLRFQGTSIPGFLPGSRGPDDDAAPPWLLDPLAEFAGLRDEEEFGLGGAGLADVPAAVERRNDSLLAALGPVTEALHAASSDFTDSGTALPAHQVEDAVRSTFEAAATANRALELADLLEIVEWSLTASLCLRSAPKEITVDSEFNWTSTATTVGEVLRDHLGGARGLKNVGARTLTFAMRHGLRRRVMEMVNMAVGDVVVYLRHRERILARVDEAVRAVPGDDPVHVVGHSLGGIIGFEYALRHRGAVSGLATVGSQVGLFGEWDCFDLAADPHTGKLVPELDGIPWLNLYDPSDFVSFLAEPVFLGVRDVAVDNRAPFPVSHSEYWRRSETFAHLAGDVILG